MTLFPVVHAGTLTDPRRIAALYRALGIDRVSVKGLAPADASGLARLCAAVVTAWDNTINFEQGSLAEAWPALGELVDTRTGYLDVRTTTADLRVWPAQFWVRGSRTVDATSARDAFDAFREVAGTDLQRGFVLGVNDAAKACLPRFLAAIRARVTGSLELAPDAGAALQEALPFERLEWQADNVIVDLPAGTITSYVTQTTRDDEPAIRARVAAALTK